MSVSDSTTRTGLHWLWVSALVIVLDQVTKLAAESALSLYEQVAVFPGLNMTLSYNRGAAFSFLAQAGGWQRWFFIVLAIGISIMLVVWLRRTAADERWLSVSLALILGGALGNVIDRIYLGHVIDFIDVYYQDWHWPAFNVADSAITVGAVMLVIDSLRPRRRSGELG